MSDGKIHFVARLTSEVTREVKFDVDEAEFLEWSNQGEVTPAKIKEFLEAHRDREEIEDAMWSLGHEVDTAADPFIDIEKITLT